MNITIVGATGGVGRQLLDQALIGGHHVTVVVRRPDAVEADVRIVATDLAAPDPAALADAVAGADAVLSGLGPRSKADAKDRIVSRATRSIIRAMASTGARRLVVVSAVPVGTVPSPARPHPPRGDRADGIFMTAVLNPIIRAAFRDTYDDLAEMEDAVTSSELDWTIVRPPRLLNKPLTGIYRTQEGRNLRRGLATSRADLAHFILRAAEVPASFGEIVRIGY